MKSWLIAALASISLLMPAAASEQLAKITFGSAGQKGGEPIVVSAEQVTFDIKAGLTVLSGTVFVEQGQIEIKADLVEVYSLQDQISEVERIVATGNLNLTTESSTASADEGVYDVRNQKIVLSGNIVVISGDNRFAGSGFEYDLATGISSLTGRPSGTVSTGN